MSPYYATFFRADGVVDRELSFVVTAEMKGERLLHFFFCVAAKPYLSRCFAADILAVYAILVWFGCYMHGVLRCKGNEDDEAGMKRPSSTAT